MLEIKNLTKRYDETIIKNLNIILPSTGLIGSSAAVRRVHAASPYSKPALKEKIWLQRNRQQ